MIDIVDPDAPFDAAMYGGLAEECMRSLRDSGRVPFVTGGTGLYIKSLLYGMSDARSADPAIRKQLEAEAEETGSAALHCRLAACDPETAARIHPNDAFRIIRALEFYTDTGEPISAVHERHRFAVSRYRVLKLCLIKDRARLYEHINRRVDVMIESGLVREVEGLLHRGYGPDLKSMQSIGYRHMCDYLSGKTNWDETLFLLKRDTRRFAKRQFTWFRADPEIIWVDPAQRGEIEELIRNFLTTGPPPSIT
jgi:tRNA dimethylallyltransferase